MKQVTAKGNYLLLHENGEINYPFSKYLTHQFDNPNTRELVAQSLRILYVFLMAHGIELFVRAAGGLCLTYDECKKLVGLCYRPLKEIKTLSYKKILNITSAEAEKPPKSLSDAVEPNTAKKRLHNIALYLWFYYEVFLQPIIRSNTLRSELRQEYEKTKRILLESIQGTSQGHHHEIQSLPSDKFLEIIRAIFLRPDELFLTKKGKPSRTLLRNRALTLLACECQRPGALGNCALSDFRGNSGHLVVHDNRKKREKITSTTPLLKGGDSTQINYASEGMIMLWPFTVDAINDYINTERKSVLSKCLKNKSKGFLFLNENGEPIKHRSTITTVFNRLGKRLKELNLLEVGNDPYFWDKKQYDFYGYVLRHSSANLFLEYNGTDDKTLDKIKARFGWTSNSKQPQRYAARTLSDQSNINLIAFYEELMSEVRVKKKMHE